MEILCKAEVFKPHVIIERGFWPGLTLDGSMVQKHHATMTKVQLEIIRTSLKHINQAEDNLVPLSEQTLAEDETEAVNLVLASLASAREELEKTIRDS